MAASGVLRGLSVVTMNFRKLLLTCLLLVQFLVIRESSALYEDQVGKFDWKQHYVGRVKFAYIDPATSAMQKFIVATEQNVIASLHARSGTFAWRQLLEKGELGVINGISSEGDFITVSGNGQYVRSWSPNTGILNWETPLRVQHSSNDMLLKLHVASSTEEIAVVHIKPGSYVIVSIHNLKSADVKISAKVPAPWIRSHTSCEFISHDFFVCVDERSRTLQMLPVSHSGAFVVIPLASLGLKTIDAAAKIFVRSLPYQGAIENPLFSIQLGQDGAAILQTHPPGIKLIKELPKVNHVTSTLIDDHLSVFAISPVEKGYTVKVFNAITWEELQDLAGSFSVPSHHGRVAQVFVLPYMKKDKGYSYKLLLAMKDHALVLIHQQGKVLWTREEALASIITAEILDLPLSETDAKIEQEFGVTDANLLTLLMTRLSTQVAQLQSLLLHTLVGLQKETTDIEGETIELTRDKFGLHKVIVVATSASKVFGIDNLSGKIVWSQFIDGLKPFQHHGKITLPIFVQRTTAHFPYSPHCTILGRHKASGKGYIYSFNPITGQTMANEVLPYQVFQATTLGHLNHQYMRGILLLDYNLQAQVYPESCSVALYDSRTVHYIFTTDVKTGTLTGYSMVFSTPQVPKATEAWKVLIPKETQTITHVVMKRPTEHVHSQGRVMGDRSVLYKYLNPNLIAVAAEGSDPIQKSYLNIYLIDAVTGAMIYSTSHKRAKGPVHLVHSENWITYSYFNEKSRRMEMSVMELYEGKTQSNTTAFSSLHPPPPPLVEHQTYIFPTGIEAMADTMTERGITNRHLLIALPSGGILELPKAFLDPRRPIHPTPEHREEGLIPYMPELPISSENIINYNQSIFGIRGIQTAPSGLESTCLVIVYGLDLFYTRVTPSKTFDILKDDFDHILISAVLLALLLVSYVSKKLAARKALRAAWK